MMQDFEGRAKVDEMQGQMFAGRLPEARISRRAFGALLVLGALALLVEGDSGGQALANDSLSDSPASGLYDHDGSDGHGPDYVSDWQPQCEGDDGGLLVGDEEFYIVGDHPNQRILSGGPGTEVASEVKVTMDGQDTCGNPYYQTRYTNAVGEPVVHTATGDYARNGAGGITEGK